MKGNCNYQTIGLALCLVWFAPTLSMGQSFLASTSAAAKVKNVTLGEGLATANQPLLLELITKSGLMPVLTGSEEYTFFAPSEKALVGYQNASPDELRQLLSQHLVLGIIHTEELKDGSDLKTIAGNTIKIYRKKWSLLVNGMRVEEGNTYFANGVWHQLKGCLKSAQTTTL